MSTTVLGSFPAYIELSDKLGARRFDLGSLTWVALGAAGHWTANREFLDQMVDTGDHFVFSNDPGMARPGTWFFRELAHLSSRGRALSRVPAWA